MTRRWPPAALALLASAAALADDTTGREQFNATLWMQIAPEYRALVQQAYRLASEKIANPPPGSAAVEQANVPADELARLPTAVVLDLDETVLDNTVYQARLVRDHKSFDLDSWGRWVMAAQAE